MREKTEDHGKLIVTDVYPFDEPGTMRITVVDDHLDPDARKLIVRLDSRDLDIESAKKIHSALGRAIEIAEERFEAVIEQREHTIIMENITLGKLIDALKAEPEDNPVRFDFCYFRPGDLHSYRGWYNDLAFDYYVGGDLTVKQLLYQCEVAVGQHYEGYKGGCYHMDENTRLWVADPEDVTCTAIIGVQSGEGITILQTGYIG